MRWRVVGASVAGTSHTAHATPCQDECWASADEINGQPTLMLFAADGAGSASHGREGADLAVRSAVAFFESRLVDGNWRLDETVAAECVATLRARLTEAVSAQGLMLRDMASTFIAVVGSSTEGLVFQIGDGAAVVDVGDGLTVPVEPMNGEYANTTRFLSDDDARDQLVAVSFDKPFQRAAVFTDGVQRLALHLATNTPHEPFFQAFFETLAAAPEDRQDDLARALHAYLNSDVVNERTDDDKTLALAVSVG